MNEKVPKLVPNVKSNKFCNEQSCSIISCRIRKNSNDTTSRLFSSFILRILTSTVEDFKVISKIPEAHKRHFSNWYRNFTFANLSSKTRTHVSHNAWSHMQIFFDLRLKHHIQVRLLKIFLQEMLKLLIIALWMHTTLLLKICIFANMILKLSLMNWFWCFIKIKSSQKIFKKCLQIFW